MGNKTVQGFNMESVERLEGITESYMMPYKTIGSPKVGDKRSILNVGCGNDPHGTINCDLFVESTEHRNVGDKKIKPKKIPNFVKCDAHYLPFKDDSIEIVYSHHVLEHLDHPLIALQEWSRVAKKKLIIIVPDLKISRVYGEFGPHLYSWSKWTLQTLVKKVCAKVEVHINRQPLRLRRKEKIFHIINFILKRIMIHMPILQNSELIAVGYLS